MNDETKDRCAKLIDACHTIRMLLGTDLPDQDADALAAELAARGVRRADRTLLLTAAGKIEQAFHEEPDPA